MEYELRFGAEHPNEPVKLEGFLEQIALVSDIDKFDPDAAAIKLMTVHMAKGLEFENVFIVGVEEELMPSSENSDTPSDTPMDVNQLAAPPASMY